MLPQMMKKIVATILLALSLAACADTERRCFEQCGGKGYQDERCQSLCSDNLSGSPASPNP